MRLTRGRDPGVGVETSRAAHGLASGASVLTSRPDDLPISSAQGPGAEEVDLTVDKHLEALRFKVQTTQHGSPLASS